MGVSDRLYIYVYQNVSAHVRPQSLFVLFCFSPKLCLRVNTVTDHSEIIHFAFFPWSLIIF